MLPVHAPTDACNYGYDIFGSLVVKPGLSHFKSDSYTFNDLFMPDEMYAAFSMVMEIARTRGVYVESSHAEYVCPLAGWISKSANLDLLNCLPLHVTQYVLRQQLEHGLLQHPRVDGARRYEYSDSLLAELIDDRFNWRCLYPYSGGGSISTWFNLSPYLRWDIFVKALAETLPRSVEYPKSPLSQNLKDFNTLSFPCPVNATSWDNLTPPLTDTSKPARPSRSPAILPLVQTYGQCTVATPSAQTDIVQERIKTAWRVYVGARGKERFPKQGIPCVWSSFFGGKCMETSNGTQVAARHLLSHIPDLDGKLMKTIRCKGMCGKPGCEKSFNRTSSLTRHHPGRSTNIITGPRKRKDYTGADGKLQKYACNTKYFAIVRPWCTFFFFDLILPRSQCWLFCFNYRFPNRVVHG